jgi:heptosyltransferase-3
MSVMPPERHGNAAGEAAEMVARGSSRMCSVMQPHHRKWGFAKEAASLQTIRRVLFIKLRHIGDVLLTTATFKALKTARPDVRISVVVPAGTESMLTLHPSIDEVIPMRRNAGLWSDLRLIWGLRRRCFDLAVNMTEGDRGALLVFLSGARLRFGVDPMGRGFAGKRRLYTHLIPPVYDGRHRAVMDMDVLGPLGIDNETAEVELFISEEDQERMDRWLEGHGLGGDRSFVTAHPTSRWQFKCWRNEAVAQVVDRLQSMGVPVVLTCGPDPREVERLEAIVSLCRNRPLVLAGELSLKELGALVRRSALFFGVDTAPMHMAAALGKPVVALFGPSDSAVWGPLTPLRRVIERREEFPCLPCRQDGCGGSKRSRCLEAITVDEAMEAIEQLLEANAGPAGVASLS